MVSKEDIDDLDEKECGEAKDQNGIEVPVDKVEPSESEPFLGEIPEIKEEEFRGDDADVPQNHLESQEAVVQQYLQSQQHGQQVPIPQLAPSEIDLRELQTLPPDGGWGWIIVAGSFLSMIIVDGICFSFGIFLTELEEYFESTKQKITWCSSLLTGCYLIAGPGASALVNRYGFRPIVVLGGIFGAIAFMASSFIKNIDFFIVVYGVFGGLSFGLIYLPGVTIVGHWFSTHRASATGIAVCGSGIGMIIYGFVSPVLIDKYTWRGALMIFSAMILNCVVAGALFIPLEEYQERRANKIAHQRQMEIIARTAAATAGPMVDSGDDTIEPNGTMGNNQNAKADDKGGKASKKKKSKKPIPSSKKKKIAIHRGSIMQKIIEEKQRQRTTSVGSLDGMIITRENTLIEPPVDYFEKPMLSMNAIHRIMDQVIRRQQDRRSTGSSGLLAGSGQVSSGTRSRQNSSKGGVAAAAVIKSSMPQLVTEYIQSQQSLQRDSVNRHTPVPHQSPSQSQSQWASIISLDPWMGRITGGSPLPPAEAAAAREELVSELKHEMARPMNRMDMMYTGSMHHVPEYISQPDVRNYVCSVTNLPEEPNRTKADILRLFDVGIFKSKTFLLLSLSSIFSMLGFLIPYAFVSDYAVHMGISKSAAGHLISIIGFANTIGRVLSGILSDQPWADCLWINNISMILAGLATMMLPLFTQYGLLIGYAIVFGLCIAAFASLRSIILVELLGLEKLTNAFGFLLLFQGVAIMLGPPFAGSLYDRTKSFDATFILGGAFMLFSGLICIPVRRLSRWEALQGQRRRHEYRYGGSEGSNEPRDLNTQVDECLSTV